MDLVEAPTEVVKVPTEVIETAKLQGLRETTIDLEQLNAQLDKDCAKINGDNDCVFMAGYSMKFGFQATSSALSRYVFDVGAWDKCQWIVFHGASGHPASPYYANQNVTWAKGEMVLRRYPDLEIEHVHHAGNSSGVVDGAGALLITSPEYAKAHGMKPRARVVAVANVGDDPTLMLNAPGPAARKVLAKAGLTIDDIDLFEVNEAFAVVTEKFIRDLDIDRSKINVNGGAIALGHPIGATGAMLIGTLLDELERTDGRYGLVTMCAAGGMAPAIIIERI